MREMKDSGVAWIGEIPETWKVTINKTILKNISERNHPDAEVLSLYRDIGVVPKNSRDDNHNVTSENTAQYKFVEKGSLVINKMKAWQGSLAVSNYEGIVSPAYYVCEFRNDHISKDYVHYLLRSNIYAQQFERLSTGMRIGQWDLSIDDFLATPLLVPPEKEQFAIAECLDKKSLQIDSLIANVQAQIEKLKAYKQSLITEVVTKGLDPNAPMKDSGVEWIGKIPAHWGTAKLQYCAELRSGITLGKKYPKDIKLVERPYLRVANVQSGGVTLENIKTVQVTEEEDAQYRLTAGEVLMTEGGDRDKLGRGCVWNGQIEPCLHQNHIFALRTSKNLDPQFLSYVTASKIGRVYFDITAIKTTNLACTNSSKVLAFKLPLPPIKEQQGITEHLNNRCAQIEQLISLKESKIEKLQQYKRSLIYEYVIGKKEVV